MECSIVSFTSGNTIAFLSYRIVSQLSYRNYRIALIAIIAIIAIIALIAKWEPSFSRSENTGHIHDPVAQKIAPLLRSDMTAPVTGESRDAREGKWTSGGGIEIPCKYILYGEKKDKNCIRNHLK